MIKDIYELTPIEIHENILLKRDDLFKPFDDTELNGGKMRQAIFLIKNYLEEIRTKYNNTVITCCNFSSPQALIISRVCKEYNVKSIICYGSDKNSTNEDIMKRHKMFQLAYENGSELRKVASLGYSSVLTSRVNEIASKDNYFNVSFGINIEDENFVDITAQQVKNLPDDLYNLVIPCGSGIISASILYGLYKFKKKVNNVYVVQISDKDRKKTIERWLEPFENYTYIRDKTYDYNTKVNIILGNIELDNIYEAKAYDYMLKHIDINKKTMFWIVGNQNSVRNH
ncbi:MAG: hypothetical protein ABSG25_03790 [Bryobacteraceae bacterium]